MAQAHRILSDWWRASGNEAKPQENGGAVAAQIEQRYTVILPEDFRDYIVFAAPHDELWDHEDTIWWPAKRIKNIPDEYTHTIKNSAVAARASKYLFFADYMIWAWAWAICCDDSDDRGRIAVINGVDDRFVADSFDDFVRVFVTDPLALS